MLTAVPHGLRAQRKRFVLIMTDVKSAFNHTPTAYMDQRYEGLGTPHDLQIAEGREVCIVAGMQPVAMCGGGCPVTRSCSDSTSCGVQSSAAQE
jgi:hypothetical protein